MLAHVLLFPDLPVFGTFHLKSSLTKERSYSRIPIFMKDSRYVLCKCQEQVVSGYPQDVTFPPECAPEHVSDCEAVGVDGQSVEPEQKDRNLKRLGYMMEQLYFSELPICGSLEASFIPVSCSCTSGHHYLWKQPFASFSLRTCFGSFICLSHWDTDWESY